MIRLLLGLFFFLINMSLNLFSNSEYYYGACDASATVLLDENMILVADDEDNLLRLYSIKRKGLPIKTFPLNKFLGLTKSSHPEADIEACTRVGNLIYWITSHGRSKKGKWRNSRYRLFATEFKKENGDYVFLPRGRPCVNLIDALIEYKHLGLKKNIGQVGKNGDIFLAPKENGLNIEGLTSSPDGKIIYIGLRNPVPNNKALLIPLTNAEDVILKSAKPLLGDPIYLNLDKRGIRSVEYSSFHNKYFIIGGSIDNEMQSALYSWSGDKELLPKLLKLFPDMNPEAIAVQDNSAMLHLFSDDGNVKYKVTQEETNEKLSNGFSSCKSLKNSNKKRFRSITININ